MIWVSFSDALRALRNMALMLAVIALTIAACAVLVGLVLVAIILVVAAGLSVRVARQAAGHLRRLEEDLALINLDPDLQEDTHD